MASKRLIRKALRAMGGYYDGKVSASVERQAIEYMIKHGQCPACGYSLKHKKCPRR